MPDVCKTVLVPHSAARMFELVDRVEDYPQFLPWSGGAEVLRRDENVTVATVRIDFHQIKQEFTTENHKRRPEWIEMRLVSGPFRQLNGSWRFIELAEDACKIEFSLHYEFASKLLEVVVGPVFSHIANTFVDSFIKRADALDRRP